MVGRGTVVVGAGMVAGASTADADFGVAASVFVSRTETAMTTMPMIASTAPAAQPTVARERLCSTSGPIASQPRRSASFTSGGTTTRADNSATAMLMVTTMPKSDSNGSVENISTANPPRVVSADVKNARPVCLAAMCVLSVGSRPRLRSSA